MSPRSRSSAAQFNLANVQRNTLQNYENQVSIQDIDARYCHVFREHILGNAKKSSKIAPQKLPASFKMVPQSVPK